MTKIDELKAAALTEEAARHLNQGDMQKAAALAARALALAPEHAPAASLAQRIGALALPSHSVVIPTCNRLDILRRCMECLERQVMPHDRFEVIVVDDASTDGTVEFLTTLRTSFAFRFIPMPERGGPARARNAGIRAARGEIVHFLNDDALIEPDVLAIHAALHAGLVDTPVSVLGRFDFGPPFTASLWGYALQHGDLLFRYPTFTHNGLHGHTSYYSCNISTPRRALVQAGLFDEAFTGRLWGAEDMEFGIRLEALPAPVVFRDDSRSTHVHDVGVEGLARTALVRGGGAVRLFARHGRQPHYARIGPHDVAYWRNLPPRVTERMRQLHAVLAHAETLRPAMGSDPTPYLRRDDYPDMHGQCLGLWRLRTRELLHVIDEVEQGAEALLRDVRNGLDMQHAAAALYPAMLFIRFFHDTIGVCSVDAIRHFCPDAPPLEGHVTGGLAASARDANRPADSRNALNTPSTPATSPTPDTPGAPDASQGMRVLLACNFFWPSVGGTELFVEQLGLQLTALGHRVEIACRWQEQRAADSLHGMRIHSFRCHGKFTDAGMGPDTERYRNLVRNGGYDAVVVLAHPDNWACHLLADLPRDRHADGAAPRPKLIMMPSINAENMDHWESLGVMDTITRTLRNADACITVSENGHDSRVCAALGVPHVFIPHAVAPRPAPWNMRQRLGLPPGKPLLACVGNFWPVKNQLALLRHLAAAPLDEAHDWRVVLAGGALPWDAERRFFEQCWRETGNDPRLRIVGPLPPEEATALVRDADLLLVPSLGESAGPLVVLEAMALGTPWIATPQCNAVHDEGGGIIAELNDFSRVASGLLARTDIMDALARNGREHWERCFRWTTVAPLFDALLRTGNAPDGACMPDDLRGQRQELARAVSAPLYGTPPGDTHAAADPVLQSNAAEHGRRACMTPPSTGR